MDQETERVIKESLADLPEDIRAALKSLDVPTIAQNIAEKNGLHIDQTGDLYTEIMLVALGVEKITSFQSNIQKQLSLTPAVAASITNAVNDQVFHAVRESLQKISDFQDGMEKAANEPESVGPSDRDQILSEIENPSATVPTPPTPSPQIGVSDFLKQRMTETTQNPVEKTVQPAVQPIPEKKPEGYAADPYREPLQ